MCAFCQLFCPTSVCPEKQVKAVQQESAEDEEARLEAFARELEAKQQQAAE